MEIDRNLDDLPSVRVSLYTQSGDLIYGKWRFDLPFEEDVIRPAAERSGERWYVLDTRMSFPDAEDIWLRCYISADAAANLNDMSATLLLALLPALVVVAGVGGYFIARRAFRPVTRIARTAESIIDGKDLQKRIGLQGARDELYRLSKVFDDMLDRLEHSFERERRFTSDASHELRTPVAAILAQADFALSDIANEEDREEALRDIRLRAGQMSTLIGRLLALTRMDAGQTRMEMERVDLADIAEVAAMQVEEGAAARGMTVECACDLAPCGRCATRPCSRRRCSIWRKTPSNTGARAGIYASPRARRAKRPASSWRTTAPASSRRPFPTSSSASIRVTARATPAARGWGFRWCSCIAKLHGGERRGRKRAGRGQPLYHRPATGAGGTKRLTSDAGRARERRTTCEGYLP